MRTVMLSLTILAAVLLSGFWLDSAGAQALCTPTGSTMECTDMGMNPGARYSVPFDQYDYSGSGSMVVPGGSTSAGRDLGNGYRAVPGPSYGSSESRSTYGADRPQDFSGSRSSSSWSPWVGGPPGMTDHSRR